MEKQTYTSCQLGYSMENINEEFPKVKFIKVNPDGIRGNTSVSSNIEEWNSTC